MKICDILGSTRDSIKALYEGSLESCNNVNKTIELSDVEIKYDKDKHNALLYFDLVDSSIMTMVVIKIEHVNFIKRLKLNISRNIKCKGYIGSITMIDKNEAVLTYIRENIIKAL